MMTGLRVVHQKVHAGCWLGGFLVGMSQTLKEPKMLRLMQVVSSHHIRFASSPYGMLRCEACKGQGRGAANRALLRSVPAGPA
jgi:hypothetical protein